MRHKIVTLSRPFLNRYLRSRHKHFCLAFSTFFACSAQRWQRATSAREPSRTSQKSAQRPRALVETDGRGGGHVQALRAAGHRNPHPVVGLACDLG